LREYVPNRVNLKSQENVRKIPVHKGFSVEKE
jgi:hypothetical protein